jgi:hypothetical protein
MNILYSTTPAKPLQKVSPPCFFFPLAATWRDYAITTTTSNVTAAAIMTRPRLMVPHVHTNGHVSSAPLPHSHTTHTHGCDHHQHSHGHSHRHRRDHTYDCNCAYDNSNASFVTCFGPPSSSDGHSHGSQACLHTHTLCWIGARTTQMQTSPSSLNASSLSPSVNSKTMH